MLLQPAKPFPGSETGQFQAPEEDENVEGYIWDSLQRNQQRLQQLKQEGFQDQIQAEQQLVRQ